MRMSLGMLFHILDLCTWNVLPPSGSQVERKQIKLMIECFSVRSLTYLFHILLVTHQFISCFERYHLHDEEMSTYLNIKFVFISFL